MTLAVERRVTSRSVGRLRGSSVNEANDRLKCPAETRLAEEVRPRAYAVRSYAAVPLWTVLYDGIRPGREGEGKEGQDTSGYNEEIKQQ